MKDFIPLDPPVSPADEIDPSDERTPAEIATAALMNPKGKLRGKDRRKLQRAFRDKVLKTDDREVRIPDLARLKNRLRKMPMVRVIRTLERSARRAATAMHFNNRMPNTPFGRAARDEQERQLMFYQAARVEYGCRNSTEKGC